ncbi:MAG: MATE family efflux transporter [Lachnospiraceae bacterium]|nr:MATE family efflux transporter [Lachnospiraceae bacterium]
MRSSSGKSSVDLTEGSIVKSIILFALPLLLGQIFQNLYNSVDSIVVGRAVGVTALAAVTSCADISNILIGFFTGLSVGAGVAFSRFFGAKDYDRLHRSVHTAILFSIIVGVGMVIIGIVLAPFLLHMVDCPAEVYPEALTYLRIYFIGVMFTAIYNVQSGVLRAVGDSRTPLYYLIIASVTNIILDILFVVVLHMGVAGVATATILAQGESVLLVTIKMLRTKDVYKLVPRDLKIEGPLLVDILRLGIPAAIQSCLITFSNLFVQRYVNGFGTAAMAGTGAAKKIDNYISQLTVALAQSLTTYISQCVGAWKKQRAFKSIRYALCINFVTVAVVSVPLYIFAGDVASLFTSDAESLRYAVLMIHTLIPFYIIQSFHQMFSNSVRGFGKSMVTMITSIAGLIAMRQIFLAIAMHISHDIKLVYLGWPVGWFFSALFAFIYFMFAIYRPYRRSLSESQEIS